MNATIEKIFCINLYRRSDRWQQAQAEFETHKLNVERFPAIDGHAVPGKEDLTLKPGLYGCTASHYLAIQRAKYLRLKAVMILEDDVQLHFNFKHLLYFTLADLPKDWRMLMLGGTHREPVTPLPGCNYMRVNKTLTSHGYVLHNSMYDNLLEKLAPMQEPVDCVFAEIQKYYKVYITNPPLAWQRPGYSDIELRDMDYPWLKSNNQ